ncbi:uncharacterized protein LOC117478578 [Trematomus bernacchii]|uniref:uncharacterized protein LOC117478578 n=1 Tax=Trematomus bernacchii TaxID=40690 RepID=UPI00146B5EF3|nr:uncharacterized protein LOC117478578 [Trematomus bernacchii]
MEKVLLIIIALSGLSAVSSHAERQYHFVSEAKNMSEAQRYCREKHTDLATVDSMEVVELLNNMAGQYKQSAWIGLYDDRDTWKWSMSDPSFYGPGETEFRGWQSGLPYNAVCCGASTQLLWAPFSGPDATFVPINIAMTWTEAQSYCREHHTDLASVRNQTENQQIVELVSRSWYWIGLYRDSWKWSDGSNFSFKYWKVNEPNYIGLNACVAAAFDDSGEWEDLDCGVKKPLICYGPVPVVPVTTPETSVPVVPVTTPETSVPVVPVTTPETSVPVVPVTTPETSVPVVPVTTPETSVPAVPVTTPETSVPVVPVTTPETSVPAVPVVPVMTPETSVPVVPVTTPETSVPVVPVTTPETSVPAVPVTTPETSVPVVPVTTPETSVPVTTPETSVPVVPVTTPDTSVPAVPVTTPETSVPVVPVTTPETSVSAVPVVPVVPVSMKVIKVRVENPNGVDLNDQAFLDAMLVEAKKNLRAQGLDDNVQLAWRKQPDGKVFHEEEEKKRDDSLLRGVKEEEEEEEEEGSADEESFVPQQLHIYSLIPKERNREETRMETVLLIIIALSGLSAVSSHAERQYHFVSEAKTMSEAQRYCREKHTDLATVDSMEVVELLNNMAGQYNQSAWIGLYDDRDTWKWSMSDPSFYGPGETEFRPWGTGQPSNWQDYQCTYFYSGGTGTWFSLYRHYPLWVICFDVTGQSATFVLIKSLMTWTDAQSYCREHHTDLASVRNQAENQQLDELIPGGGYNAWIGLYRDSWKWSDGSNSSFKYWKVNEPNYRGLKACVAAAFDDSGKWEDLDCGVEKPFICYGHVVPVVPVVPVSMKVIKVSVEKPNGVDLNDPAFLDAMLVEAKKNLRAQGLDDNVQLAWRKQPDGQVFHEEEEKKRDEL